MFEEHPEPSGKEHDFGHDEHDKAIAQTDTNNRCVVAYMGFSDDVSPPCVHSVENCCETHQKQVRTAAVHPENCAKEHGKRPNRGHKWPNRGV